MQVYKVFFKIASKYRVSVIIYSVVFLALLFIMSSMGEQENTGRFQASAVTFAVVDEDNSAASKDLIDYLSEKHELVTLDSYEEESLQDHLYYEKIHYVLFIPKGYEENLKDGNMENLLQHSMRTDSAKGYFFNQDVKAYLDTLSIYVSGGYSMEEALEKAHTTATESAKDVVNKVFFESTTSGHTGFAYFFQYLPYVMMGCLIVAIAPILVVFHKPDIAARISCSATSNRKRNIAIGLGCITYCMFYWLLMVVIAGIAFGFETYTTSLGLYYLANSFIYTLFVISIVLLIGSFSLKVDALNLIANVIALGSSFLCGIFVPQWLLDAKVIAISRFLPAYWYIQNNNMLSGFTGDTISAGAFWKNFGMQALFAVAVLSIYLVVSTQRKAKSLA